MYPSMQLRFDGPKILLTHEMTLRDLERSLISCGEAKKSVDFHDNQGGRLSVGSKMKNVLELSSFSMNID